MTDLLYLEQKLPNNKPKTCRICATECVNGQKLFGYKSEIQKLAVLICSYISIKLENVQIYPNWICPGCQLQFQTTNDFLDLIRNGSNKLCEQFGYFCKRGRKRKEKRVHMFTVNGDQVDNNSPDNFTVTKKRIPKTPTRFKDSMRGNELEDLYSEIGITKRKTRRCKTDEIAPVEDEDDVTFDEMLSGDEESGSTSTRYQCYFCKKNFVREFSFYNHLSSHTEVLYECTECQAVFQTKRMFNEHLRETNHTGLCVIETPPLEPTSEKNPIEQKLTKQLKEFDCKTCKKSFSTNLAMQRHQETHSDNRPFKCDICLARFKCKFVLKFHKISHAAKAERRYKCHKCSKTFTLKRSLQIHLQGIHDGLKPYACPICKKCFSQKSNLNIHKRVHTGDRPYVCLRCGAAFKTSSQCILHQKTHVIEEINPEINEDIIPKKTYKCKMCAKVFSQTSNLRKHIRIHTGEKPYSCQLCQQKFSDSSNLKKHKRCRPKNKKSKSKTKPISLLKPNIPEVLSNPDPIPDGLMADEAPNSITILENIVLTSANNSLMNIINEDDHQNENLWNSDVIVTDIPNDENLIAQQQQQQEKLMNQLVCISYQDPMNPDGIKKNFYVLNQEN